MCKVTYKHLTPAIAIRRLESLPADYIPSDHAILMIVPEHKALEFFQQTGNHHLPSLAKLLKKYRHAYKDPWVQAKLDELSAA